MVPPVDIGPDRRPVTHHSRSICPASELYPPRRSTRRRPRTRLIWLVGLTVAGMMAEELEALATEHLQQHLAPIKLGQKYQLSTESRFTGVCDDSGCDSTEHEGPLYRDAILLVHLEAESGDRSPTITMAGNAIFVAPVTGTLKVEGFADPPISDEQKNLVNCTNIRWKSKSLDAFSADEVP